MSSDGTQRRPGGGAADLAAAVWRAGVEADGTPGAVYLRGRGAWPGPVAALRWLPAVEAARIGLRPRLPDGAAGALLYRFAATGELGTAAVQCEAVADGNAREGRLPGRCGAAGPDALSGLFGQNVRFFLTEPRRSPAAAGLPRPEAGSGAPEGLS